MVNMKNKEIWIFLSHSNVDYDKVCKVRNMLEEQGLRPIMFFLKCLNDDDEIDDLIKREIDCRTRFILCDSPNARCSTWVKRELEYINSKDKPFETIDLSKSDEEINRSLVQATRKTRIFISYSRTDYKLAKSIYTRLSKYDIFTTWLDMYELKGGYDFKDIIEDNLKKAIGSGFVICLLSSDSLREGSWTRREIELMEINLNSRLDFKNNIIPIYTEDYTSLSNILRQFPILSRVKGVEYNGINIDSVIDSIISQIIAPGTLLTYASNFENGFGVKKDIEEAEKLKQLYFHLAKEAEAKNIPTGIRALGRCYEFGIGTSVDMCKAYELYSDTFATDGLCIEDAKRVHSILYPIEKKNCTNSFWYKIISKFKRNN